GEGAAVKAAPAPEKKAAPAAAPVKAQPPAPAPQADGSPVASAPATVRHDDDEHARSSPLVRKIAREHNVNLSQVEGTGLGGRITKQDIQAFIESGVGASTGAPSSSRPTPASGATGASPVQPGVRPAPAVIP